MATKSTETGTSSRPAATTGKSAKKSATEKAKTAKPKAKTAKAAKAGSRGKAKTTAKTTAKTKAAKTKTPAKKTAKTPAKTTAKTKATAKTGARVSRATGPRVGASAKQQAPGEAVHCYRLIFQVDPGGSRKAESFVAGTLAQVRRAALDDLKSGMGAYHALFYGEEIVLECWEGARRVTAIDLHPFITYRIEGLDDPVTLPAGDEAPLSMDDEPLMMGIFEEERAFKVEIDWASIPLPALGGRPLRRGESMKLERGRSWAHGFHSHWDMKIETAARTSRRR